MADTLFLNPAKALGLLAAAGYSEEEAIAILVSLKGGKFTVSYEKTAYFDPRELTRLSARPVTGPRPSRLSPPANADVL